MNTCVISGAVVLSASKNASPIEFGRTEGGLKTATFKIGEDVYDTSYPDRKRFNNYYVIARGQMAERIEHMNLKAGACVNVVCRMDLSKTVLERQESGKSKDDPSYGRIRYVKGLRLELLDISYASGQSSAEAVNTRPNETVETSEKPESVMEGQAMMSVPEINLDECNILTRKPRRYFT